MIYDNNANVIDYFSLQNKPKKKKRKNEFVVFSELTDEELYNFHIETKIKLEDLTELYNETKSNVLFKAVEKVSRFRTRLRIEMKRRKVPTYSEAIEYRDKYKSINSKG